MTTNLNLVKVQVFTKVPKPRFVIDIETEPGTDIELTNSIALELENILVNTPEVSRFAVTVGESGVQNMRLNQGSAIGSEIAQINVDLIDKKDRIRTVDEIIINLQQHVVNIPGVNFKFSIIKEGPPIEDKLVIDIQGENLEHISDVSEFIGYSPSQFLEILERFRNKNLWQRDSSGTWYIPGHLEDQ